MHLSIDILFALQILIPAIVGMIQERADKQTVTALATAAIAAGIFICVLQFPDLRDVLSNKGVSIVCWICVATASVAAVIAGLRMKNKIMATLMLASSITMLLVLLNIVKLGSKVL